MRIARYNQQFIFLPLCSHTNLNIYTWMKTTLKVKLRLPCRGIHTGSLYINLTHRRQTSSVSTCLRISTEEWDELRQEVVIPEGSPPGRKRELFQIRKKLKSVLKEVGGIIARYSSAGDFSPKEVITHYRNRGCYGSVVRYMQRRISQLRQNGRFGTAHAAQNALRSFLRYRSGQDLPLSRLDALEIQSYERYLRNQSYSLNTISTYLRALRSAYNEAVREKIVENASVNPFLGVFTGNATTRKLAADKQTISRIVCLDLKEKDTGLSLAQDLFLFSFYCRGMAYVDMVRLMYANIQDGCLRYKRQKTGQEIEVKITPAAQAIINRYRQRYPDREFLFPVLSCKGSLAEHWRQYQSGLGRYNRHLKRLSRKIGVERNLTGYVSRHSWATIARNEGIPLATISRGLGHESERTTRTYIGRLDNRPIDEANELVIKTVSNILRNKEINKKILTFDPPQLNKQKMSGVRKPPEQDGLRRGDG